MTFDDAYIAVQDLEVSIPTLFDGIEVARIYGNDRLSIGDRTAKEKQGVPQVGDGVGAKSGIYLFGTPEQEILYIGKASQNNLHQRIWDHIRTPKELPDGNWSFPAHSFPTSKETAQYVEAIRNGQARLEIITVSDSDLASLLEVYLQTLHKKQHGRLPAFNRQIG